MFLVGCVNSFIILVFNAPRWDAVLMGSVGGTVVYKYPITSAILATPV